jgi:hypothetical protein
MQHRFMTIVAATSAALALGAAPALAGSDGCSGGDCQDENTPAQVVPAVPTPAPLRGFGGGNAAPEQSSTAPTTHRTRHVVRSHAVTVAQRTVPHGAVAAGAGGTAPQGPGSLLVGLGGAALVLLAAGGGLVAAGRQARP